MKSVLLIGLGLFGRHMAEKLRELHHEVLAVDRDKQRVNDILPLVTNAQIGDSTNEQFIASLGVRQKYHINVLAIRHGGKLEPLPGPTHCFKADETVFILGSNRDAQRFLNL